MIRPIDTRFQGQEGIIAVFAIPHQTGVALVESGPESTFPRVAEALERMGYGLGDVTDVFLTHIHLDHAGAAWRFAEAGARIHVHPRGARHLADPSRLIQSAERIYGDRMKPLWGELRPVPAERLAVAEDGARVSVGGLTLVAHETLGHAVHHHAWQLGDALFTGDVAGVRLGGGPALPPCPPPDIHVEDWLASIERVRRLAPETLYLTHFGAYVDVERHLEELAERLKNWAEWIRRGLRQGKDAAALVPDFEAHVKAELEAAGLDAASIARYELANPSAYSVFGLARYWQKHRPEALEE